MLENLAKHLSPAAVSNIERWLTEAKYSEYKSELEALIKQEKWQELEDGFFKVLEFGTAGRRGTVGVGSNRINRVTIGESTQALCQYAKQFDEQAPRKGIVIAYDTRLSSPELSQYAARVCAGNGFKTYIFDGFRSTPELSFAVRALGCSAGIVISASHNPPQDNGFKAYWNDGAQVTAPHDAGILTVAEDITDIAAVPDFDEAVNKGEISIIGRDVDEAYLTAVVSQTEGVMRDLKIVYSPLHGAGQRNTLPALQRAGFTDIVTVAEQMVPDGNFPTVPGGKSNPEEKAANAMAVEKMLQEQADIAITNDPDADRIGVIVNHHGEPVYLSGNQSLALAVDYALMKKHEKQELTPSHYIANSIVTTDMLNALAKKYGVMIYDDCLIGFKYIGQIIRENEGTDRQFVIGGEESFGILKGDYARDKDGASGALPLAEYAAELKARGKTLVDRLYELYRELGLFVETLEVAVYPGAEGFNVMQSIMTKLRQSPPREIGGHRVSAWLDYSTLTRITTDGASEDIESPKSNILVFELGDHRRRITIRPSGTEPKLKCYIQWHEHVSGDVDVEYMRIRQELGRLFQDFSAAIVQ